MIWMAPFLVRPDSSAVHNGGSGAPVSMAPPSRSVTARSASAGWDDSYRRRGAGMSVFTAAELAYLRTKPRLAPHLHTLLQPVSSYR